VIGFLLVVQVPDASNVRGVTVLLRPLNGFLLRLARGEDVVRMVLDYVIGDECPPPDLWGGPRCTRQPSLPPRFHHLEL